MRSSKLVLIGVICALGHTASAQLATKFLYQGRLLSNGQGVNAPVDMTFTLWDAVSGGGQIGVADFHNGVVVADGLFTVEVNEANEFGDSAFDGNNRWLQIDVNGTTLTPRQPLDAAPYASFALSAPGSGLWTSSGTAITNTNAGFVGINRASQVTGAEYFGVQAPVDSGYGGMYIRTDGATALPFYGYRAGGSSAWTYLDGGSGTWRVNVGNSDRLVITSSGLVGIGPAAGAPENTLHVAKGSAGNVTAQANAPLVVENSTHAYVNLLAPDASESGVLFGQPSNSAAGGIVYNNPSTPQGLQFRTNGNSTKMVIDHNGNVGIGVAAPNRKLQISASSATEEFYVLQTGVGRCAKFQTINDNADSTLTVLGTSDINSTVVIQNFGTAPALEVGGNVRVSTLEITGADVAEKFPISDEVEPGMVVMIDADHPGQLCLARGAYNKCVAGVVSGANGLSAGTILGNLPGQENATPIAISGRVWVHCDTSQGPIEAGDRLTTSNRPGHAMAIGDARQADGAIIGKAMTPLAKGEKGMVLVLVNLQ